MEEERNPQQGEDEEGLKRLNEDEDEVEGHRHTLSDMGADEDEDEVEAHKWPRMGQTEDPGAKR